MLIIKGSRKEIFDLIRKNPEESVAFIKVKPSISLLAYLFSETKVKKIYFTPGILKTVNPKVLEAIRRLNIHFQIYTVKRGPPYKTTSERIKQIILLIKNGMPVSQACEKAGIPRRTFYYRLKKQKIGIEKIKRRKIS
ncbi:helix-turn-helix domain-containing protein [Candidatus Micrarchaeota archaeon]|nr:helix-turn-helix domain-containing protein [Candidatus Micrarchaeota archaeon]